MKRGVNAARLGTLVGRFSHNAHTAHTVTVLSINRFFSSKAPQGEVEPLVKADEFTLAENPFDFEDLKEAVREDKFDDFNSILNSMNESISNEQMGGLLVIAAECENLKILKFILKKFPKLREEDCEEAFRKALQYQNFPCFKKLLGKIQNSFVFGEAIEIASKIENNDFTSFLLEKVGSEIECLSKAIALLQAVSCERNSNIISLLQVIQKDLENIKNKAPLQIKQMREEYKIYLEKSLEICAKKGLSSPVAMILNSAALSSLISSQAKGFALIQAAHYGKGLIVRDLFEYAGNQIDEKFQIGALNEARKMGHTKVSDYLEEKLFPPKALKLLYISPRYPFFSDAYKAEAQRAHNFMTGKSSEPIVQLRAREPLYIPSNPKIKFGSRQYYLEREAVLESLKRTQEEEDLMMRFKKFSIKKKK